MIAGWGRPLDFDKQPELKKPVTRDYNIVAERGGQEQKHAFLDIPTWGEEQKKEEEFEKLEDKGRGSGKEGGM